VILQVRDAALLSPALSADSISIERTQAAFAGLIAHLQKVTPRGQKRTYQYAPHPDPGQGLAVMTANPSPLLKLFSPHPHRETSTAVRCISTRN
jgi:hypothetical protein